MKELRVLTTAQTISSGASKDEWLKLKYRVKLKEKITQNQKINEKETTPNRREKTAAQKRKRNKWICKTDDLMERVEVEE